MKARGVGAWSKLVEAINYMDEHEPRVPKLFGQAGYISRAARQANRLIMKPIIPEGLSTDFDKKSEQIWTRSAILWIPFTGLGTLLLIKRGQI